MRVVASKQGSTVAWCLVRVEEVQNRCSCFVFRIQAWWWGVGSVGGSVGGSVTWILLTRGWNLEVFS